MKFTLNGKKIEVIDAWNKLNFEQYLRVLNLKNDMAEVLSIITGLDYETVKNSKIQGIESLLYCAQFMNVPPTVPDKITKVGKYKLPVNNQGEFDIQFESLAQFEDMRKVLQSVSTEDIQSFTRAYASYVAIYLQKIRDKEYDPMKAQEMEEDVLKMPALEVLAAGSFFTVKLLNLLNGTPKNSPNTARDRRKPIGTRSRKRSARTPRSTGFPGK